MIGLLYILPELGTYSRYNFMDKVGALRFPKSPTTYLSPISYITYLQLMICAGGVLLSPAGVWCEDLLATAQ